MCFRAHAWLYHIYCVDTLQVKEKYYSHFGKLEVFFTRLSHLSCWPCVPFTVVLMCILVTDVTEDNNHSLFQSKIGTSNGWRIVFLTKSSGYKQLPCNSSVFTTGILVFSEASYVHLLIVAKLQFSLRNIAVCPSKPYDVCYLCLLPVLLSLSLPTCVWLMSFFTSSSPVRSVIFT